MVSGPRRQQFPNLADTQNTYRPLPKYTEPADLGLVRTVYIFNKFPRECGWLGLGITAPLCLCTVGALEPLVSWKGWESIFRLWSYWLLWAAAGSGAARTVCAEVVCRFQTMILVLPVRRDGPCWWEQGLPFQELAELRGSGTAEKTAWNELLWPVPIRPPQDDSECQAF